MPTDQTTGDVPVVTIRPLDGTTAGTSTTTDSTATTGGTTAGSSTTSDSSGPATYDQLQTLIGSQAQTLNATQGCYTILMASFYVLLAIVAATIIIGIVRISLARPK